MYSPLTEWWIKLRKSIFEKVEVSQRLTTDPAIVVAAKYADSANMARIFNAQANQVKTVPRPNEKILEINANHPIIKELLHLAVNEPESESLTQIAGLVTDMAFVQSGYEVKDLNSLANNFYKTLGSSLGINDVSPKQVEVDLSEIELNES